MKDKRLSTLDVIRFMPPALSPLYRTIVRYELAIGHFRGNASQHAWHLGEPGQCHLWDLQMAKARRQNECTSPPLIFSTYRPILPTESTIRATLKCSAD